MYWFGSLKEPRICTKYFTFIITEVGVVSRDVRRPILKFYFDFKLRQFRKMNCWSFYLLSGFFAINLLLLNYDVFSLERDCGERKTLNSYATFKVFKKP